MPDRPPNLDRIHLGSDSDTSLRRATHQCRGRANERQHIGSGISRPGLGTMPITKSFFAMKAMLVGSLIAPSELLIAISIFVAPT